MKITDLISVGCLAMGRGGVAQTPSNTQGQAKRRGCAPITLECIMVMSPPEKV